MEETAGGVAQTGDQSRSGSGGEVTVTDNAMSAACNVSEPLDVDAFSREVFELIVNAHRCILCWRTNPELNAIGKAKEE
jgi:hypothetical protein